MFEGYARRDVATVVKRRLPEPDDLATTTIGIGQQWDAPNGWAPLQWIAINGLNRDGYRSLGCRIARRWIRENVAHCEATDKLVEQYDPSGDVTARGGECPLQDGFGRINSILRRLLALCLEIRERLPGAKPEEVTR